MAGEFQNQFQEAMREAEMADLKKQVDELGDTAKGLTSDFDPLDLKETTKWEPKTGSASDTPPEAPAAAPSETRDAVVPAEPVAASELESLSGQSPAAAPPAVDVGSTSEPSTVPLAEGSGRA
jgi:sec-independent protein translocase protein TatB